jgi:hypothetical protein
VWAARTSAEGAGTPVSGPDPSPARLPECTQAELRLSVVGSLGDVADGEGLRQFSPAALAFTAPQPEPAPAAATAAYPYPTLLVVDSFNHRVLGVDVLRGRLLGELPLQRQDGKRPKGIAAMSARIAFSFTSAVHLRLLHAGTRATLCTVSTGDGAPGGLRFCADGEHLVVTEPQPGRLRLRSVADGSCCGLVPSEFDGQSMLDVEECASGWIVAAGMDTPVSLIPRTSASTGASKHALFLFVFRRCAQLNLDSAARRGH